VIITAGCRRRNFPAHSLGRDFRHAQDRLHNIRTLRHLPHAKQLDKSRQALDIMVPLARTLGMEAIGPASRPRC
jgi:hypothetical protein